MRKFFKGKIRSILKFYGYDINRISSPADIRNKGNDPRQILYYGNKDLLIDAPTKWGRIRFFPLNNYNPYVLATLYAVNCKNPYNIIKNILEMYFDLVQPQGFCDWYGIENEDAPNFSGIDIWAVPDPWKTGSIEAKYDSMKKIFINESKKHGKFLTADHGDKFFGPVTDEKLTIESKRLEKVVLSIRTKGWRRHDGPDGDIEAQVLIQDDGCWRWQVTRGLHRTSVLSALGWNSIPLRIKSIVYKKDVDIWPNVMSGLYSRKCALKFFERHFNGEYPDLAESWIKKASILSESLFQKPKI